MLRGCRFVECDLSMVKLSSAVLTRCALLRCTIRKSVFFNARLDDCKLTGTTFDECDLRPLTVTGGDWSFVVARGAKLSGVTLAGVKLRDADLSDADLTRCDLRGADLAGAQLRQAALKGADG